MPQMAPAPWTLMFLLMSTSILIFLSNKHFSQKKKKW